MNSNRPQNLSAALIALEKIREQTGEKLETVTDAFKTISNNKINQSFSEILLVSPTNIINWQFHDRPQNELGNIEELAEEFKTIGQQQPCIVRPIKNQSADYEVIVGERRWLAAKKANVKLKVVVLSLSDNDAALIQIAENKNRKDLSDYAKGISFSKLIDAKIITQSELIEKLKISPQKISKLLSYTKIPTDVINKIADMSKVSATTAEKIKQLCSKGKEYIEAVKTLSNEIRHGKIGHIKLEEKVKNIIHHNDNIDNKRQIFDKNNKLIFTMHLNKAQINILLSPYIREYTFKNNQLFLDALEQFARNLENIYKNIPPEG
ncbi:MAG: ParB/RepB/Spo0J family partition protein [Rickettsiales bacterium]|nr:ParB/RepB/Spo0J family partition protein [Rickettsiales bacterium]